MTAKHKQMPSFDEEKTVVVPKRGLIGRLRTWFFTGMLVTAPAAITISLAILIINTIDKRITTLIPEKYNPETYLPFGLPGLGVVILILSLVVIGALAAGFFGRIVLNMWERFLARMPVVSSVYGATKQIFETVLAQKSQAFRQVVLVEYPRRGIWAIGFITGKTEGEVQHLIEQDVVNVFLPTTPNPTSGFLLFVPREDLVVLNMTIEEGIKMVISGGIVTPPDRRIQSDQETPVLDAHAVEREYADLKDTAASLQKKAPAKKASAKKASKAKKAGKAKKASAKKASRAKKA